MNFRSIIAAMRGLRNRRREKTLEAAGPTLHVEGRRIGDLFVCPMDTSSESILDKLDKDTITYVLSLLDTPNDLARAACVCCSWHRYVMEGEFWKKMCMKLFPEFGKDYKLLNYSDGLSRKHGDVESTGSELLLRRLLSPPLKRTCISESLHASSTDNLPHESVAQTLYPDPEYPELEMASYWSSTGQGDTSVPEMLTYRLVSDLCVVHAVEIRPFLAHFQHGHPIYSSQTVRFRFGYSRVTKPNWSGLRESFLPQNADKNEYVWTYVSPTFQMVQEDTLQTFQLPKPTVCFGGIFQIEFIGRVQTQESDGLYYICIGHVHVTGRPLSDFKFEGIDKEGEIVLKHSSQKKRGQPLLIEQIRVNTLAMRNDLVTEMLLQYLLNKGLLKEVDSEDD